MKEELDGENEPCDLNTWSVDPAGVHVQNPASHAKGYDPTAKRTKNLEAWQNVPVQVSSQRFLASCYCLSMLHLNIL